MDLAGLVLLSSKCMEKGKYTIKQYVTMQKSLKNWPWAAFFLEECFSKV